MNTNFYINQPESLYRQMTDIMTDHYSLLEKELQSLSESETSEILNFRPFIEANNAFSMYVQAELINLIKHKINANPEVIKPLLQSIKDFKNQKKAELDDFQDYIKNYSELSYKEYKELKNESK